MKVFMPPEIIYLPKAGFCAPLPGCMKMKKSRIEVDYRSREYLQRRRLFDPVAVLGMIARDRLGRDDASYVILAAACAETWSNQFVDAFAT
jgi:hypothetical protein